MASLYTTRSSIHFMPLSTGTYLALLESTVFQLFSIIIEYQLNMCWVVIATLPQVYDIYKRRNHNATMEDVEVMVFPLLGLWLFVRLGTTILVFVEPFDSLQSFKNGSFCFQSRY